jgi:hypothetical protein
MTHGMASLFVDIDLSKAMETLFFDHNCFLIRSTISVYSLRQMQLNMLAEGSTNSLRNALSGCCSSRLDIEFHGLCAETNPNMR